MKVVRFGTDEFVRDDEAVVTIGTFDGVHVGHRSILDRLLNSASRSGEGHSTVLTFDLHPQHVLRNRVSTITILTPLEEKVRKLQLLGIDRVVIIPFDREFANMSAEEFLKNILIDRIGLKRLVVGYNHLFGRNREGDIDFLRAKSREYGFDLDVIDAHTISGTAVSSTKIRNALQEGRLDTANRYLGAPYRLTGTVIKGSGRGRSLGYPTANIKSLDPDQLIPAEGVYAIRVFLDDEIFPGVGSIGRSETFGDNPLQIEAHLFDVDIELYGKKLAVELLAFIRQQKKFDNAEELVLQMKNDEYIARKSI